VLVLGIITWSVAVRWSAGDGGGMSVRGAANEQVADVQVTGVEVTCARVTDAAPAGASRTDPEGTSAKTASVAAPYEGVRVVFSLAIRETKTAATSPEKTANASPDSEPAVASVEVRDGVLAGHLWTALARGDVTHAAAIMKIEDRAERARLFGVLGKSIASAQTARRALEELAVESQIEMCQVWLRTGHGVLRPLALDSLAEISKRPELKQSVRQAELESWVRGRMAWVLASSDGAG
jgi:hypothetical protein